MNYKSDHHSTFLGNVFIDLLCSQFLQIGPSGAEYIADMLKYNSTISSLDLRANGLRDEVCLSVLSFRCTLKLSIAQCSSFCRAPSALLAA